MAAVLCIHLVPLHTHVTLTCPVQCYLASRLACTAAAADAELQWGLLQCTYWVLQAAAQQNLAQFLRRVDCSQPPAGTHRSLLSNQADVRSILHIAEQHVVCSVLVCMTAGGVDSSGMHTDGVPPLLTV